LVFKPKEVDAYIRLGYICNKTGNFEEALKLLNHASGMDKRNAQIYPEKVISLIGLERYTAGAESIGYFDNNKRNSPVILLQRGNL
jgi:tetratricopeptide (TPR) repeat protein